MASNFDNFSDVVKRFVRYVQVETTSSEESTSTPSTACQLDLLRMLRDELKTIVPEGSSVELDEKTGVLLARVPGTPDLRSEKSIGLLAHVDTSCEAPGKNVRPQLHTVPSAGGLEVGHGVTIMEETLKPYVGEQIITSDGSTLLGADDKAGVAAVVTTLEKMQSLPSRPNIVAIFTPDEEVGRGTENVAPAVLLERENMLCAYTVDGGEVGQLEWENFNAKRATVTFQGVSAHPGEFGKLIVNSLLLGAEFCTLLPEDKRPDTSCGERDGFIYVTGMHGGCEETTVKMILRSFDVEELEALEAVVRETADKVAKAHPRSSVRTEVAWQYHNMKEKMLPLAVENGRAAFRAVGVEPVEHGIRGGTDGARLTEGGLPTPNLFAGGLNFHSRAEFVPVKSLEKACEACVALVSVWGQHFLSAKQQQ